MKKEKKRPRRMSRTDSPILTGQYPSFGVENEGKLPPAERKKRGSGSA